MDTTTENPNRIYIELDHGVRIFNNCHPDQVAAYRDAVSKANAGRKILFNRIHKNLRITDRMRHNIELYESREITTLHAIECEDCHDLAAYSYSRTNF